MKKRLLTAAITLTIAAPLIAQEPPKGAPSPNEIVAGSAHDEWTGIAPEDLMVMTLAPDASGNPRQVVIQLIPAPFSEGWVDNIRNFARAGWYDNISVNRVQDNYVVQWGDPNYDNPEATGATKPLPQQLKVMGEESYTIAATPELFAKVLTDHGQESFSRVYAPMKSVRADRRPAKISDPYANAYAFYQGFPVGMGLVPGKGRRSTPLGPDIAWPVHCYGMVGVGRNYSPDTGSGAELYTVIGQAPRQLDRNIALVGRVIEGMANLSSLPRGKGELGFYADFETDKRTPILSVRIASDLPAKQQPRFEYLSSGSASFTKYADARANRRDPFYVAPAGGADICNIPVPIRRVAAD